MLRCNDEGVHHHVRTASCPIELGMQSGLTTTIRSSSTAVAAESYHENSDLLHRHYAKKAECRAAVHDESNRHGTRSHSLAWRARIHRSEELHLFQKFTIRDSDVARSDTEFVGHKSESMLISQAAQVSDRHTMSSPCRAAKSLAPTA